MASDPWGKCSQKCAPFWAVKVAPLEVSNLERISKWKSLMKTRVEVFCGRRNYCTILDNIDVFNRK